VGPDGVTFDGPLPEASFVPWDEVGPVSAAGTRVEIDGKLVAALATRRGATTVAEALAQLQALAPAARARALEGFLQARFDGDGVRQRLAAFRRETRLLSIVTNVLWLALFASLFALVRLPLVVILVPALSLVLAGWIAAPLLAERGLRRSVWLRRAWRPEPLKRVLAALTPLGAIRSKDLLARELLGDLDPLAAASALLPTRAFVVMARPRLVQLRFGTGAAPAGGDNDQAWWRAATRAHVERLLRARGVDLEALLAAPPREGGAVAAWCPMCFAQYDASNVPRGCSGGGCAGVALVRY
jgi:hypothetical protein